MAVRVNFLSVGDLPELSNVDDLADALTRRRTDDVSFAHSRGMQVAQIPDGLARGVNVFGPGRSPVMTATRSGIHRMRGISSVVLNRAIFFPNALSVLAKDNKLFLDGIENYDDP